MSGFYKTDTFQSVTEDGNETTEEVFCNGNNLYLKNLGAGRCRFIMASAAAGDTVGYIYMDGGQNQWLFAPDAGCYNSIIFTTAANREKDHGTSASTDPRAYFFGKNDPTVGDQDTEYWAATYDSTNKMGVIEVGKGPMAINASLLRKVTAIDHTDSPYLIEEADQPYQINVDTTTSAVTVTLGTDLIPADTTKAAEIIILDEGANAGANNITINTEAAETINGQNSVAIQANNGTATLKIRGGQTDWKLAD
ncbi:hypothetical protein HN682_08085 [Candidatus Peregrinibacteria bacterium]|jgi:hypothetical protein|nr:hypothetical protein [Candidatus Peregrinibacteria bacterium]